MQAYLAEKYMSGPKADAILSRAAPKKVKKKRKADSDTVSGPSMLIDDDAGFGDDKYRRQREEEQDVAEAVVASDKSFKKRRTGEGSAWTTVREGVREDSPPIPVDEQPVVVSEEPSQPFKGGLLTSDRLRQALPRPELKTGDMSKEEGGTQETVYRDASGRKIDMKLARAEAARKKRETEEKAAQKMEWGRGMIQRDEEEKRRLQLEKNKSLPFSRYADDKDMNEELKVQQRWNDPAAAFLTVSSLYACNTVY